MTNFDSLLTTASRPSITLVHEISNSRCLRSCTSDWTREKWQGKRYLKFEHFAQQSLQSGAFVARFGVVVLLQRIGSGGALFQRLFVQDLCLARFLYTHTCITIHDKIHAYRLLVASAICTLIRFCMLLVKKAVRMTIVFASTSSWSSSPRSLSITCWNLITKWSNGNLSFLNSVLKKQNLYQYTLSATHFCALRFFCWLLQFCTIQLQLVLPKKDYFSFSCSEKKHCCYFHGHP